MVAVFVAVTTPFIAHRSSAGGSTLWHHNVNIKCK